MEFWVIMVLILAVVLGAGGWAGVAAVQRRQVHARQDRWRELQGRFNRVTLDSERYDRSPGEALAAPGWLDRDSPVVRGFAGTLKRAQRDRAELERGVARAPGRAGRELTGGSRGPASGLNPSEQDLGELEKLVERVEDAYRDADRAVRTTGWTRPEALQVPHAQFLMDPRWGRPAVLPRSVAVPSRPTGTQQSRRHVQEQAKATERAVKDFLDASYPLRRETALKLLRARSGGTGPGYKVQKSFERLLASGRYVTDSHGFVWPQATVVEHWGVYRSFGRDADLGLGDLAPVEVANALWVLLPADRGLPDTELLRLAREHLALTPGVMAGLTETLNLGLSRGLKALPEGVQKTVHDAVPHGVRLPPPSSRVEQVLAAGLHEGLVTGRLQRQPDGLVRRLRAEWPSTYRR